jgi:formylglycine-generating enzyme required for sulfatase activity
MRTALLGSSLLALVIAGSVSAVTMDWTPIGNPGNACDPQPDITGYGAGCFGSVAYAYNIGTYEVTNGQYAEFLNAKAAVSDPFNLYFDAIGAYAVGITRSGSPGSYSYSAIAGRENLPVGNVTHYDILRFTNWMNNGQGNGDTETGAYTLLGPYNAWGEPSNGSTVTRNVGATILLPTEDEWYKAAYFSAVDASYFNYPAGSDTPMTCAPPSATPNSANCGDLPDYAAVGSYPASPSPYGTFDQGGNVSEWTETILESPYGYGLLRVQRGGARYSFPGMLAASFRLANPSTDGPDFGFRLAMIPGGYVPEPSTGLLVFAGLLGLAARRRRNAS